MKGCFVIVGLFLLISGSLAAQKVRIAEDLTMHSTILHQEISYSIILPKDYFSNNKSYPVVYLLHGLGDAASSWLEYGQVSQTADELSGKNEIMPMIFVMPQGFRTYYVNDYAGTFKYQDMFIRELVPFIDQNYRTIPDKRHRATMGYSMGGFGALILPLKNPDVFSVCVPLSISIRTDDQYKMESAKGWDDQWGKLFGGVGLTGDARLTDYYLQNSPFHILAANDVSGLSDLKMYIDVGDDEGTLSRSNEELHILMRNKNIKHEYRVRNGGHEFSYWRAAMPNGFRFISDAFAGKAYRGDVVTNPAMTAATGTTAPALIDAGSFTVHLPPEYPQTQRLYPAVYCIGDFGSADKNRICAITDEGFANGALPPMIMVFVRENEVHLKDAIITELEQKYRARPGFRFRALIGVGTGGAMAMKYSMEPEQFTSCAILDSSPDCDAITTAVGAGGQKALSRTWFFVSAADDANNYQANGCLHSMFREKEIYHEYRVSDGSGGMAWALGLIPEVLQFTISKIHH